jgi:hypothetical protein
MARKKPKRGRPPRHAGERLSKNRTFRVRGELDYRLQAAANESGRSVSEEIEYRLENSFRMDDLNEQIKAAVGQGFKEAMMVPLSEIGRFTPAERIARWAKRLAGLDPDKPEEAPPVAATGT